MELKRFKDINIHEAMKKVKERLGPEAVILSTNKTAAGVEIIAASSMDIDFLERKLNEKEPLSHSGQPSSQGAPQELTEAHSAIMDMQADNAMHIGQLQECIEHMSREFVQLRAANNAMRSGLHQEMGDRIQEISKHFETGFREHNIARIESYKVLQQQIDELRNEMVARLSGIGELDGDFLSAIQRDMAGLKDIVSYQTTCLDWDSWSKHHPMGISIVSQLAKAGLGIDLSKKIVGSVQPTDCVDVLWNRTVDALIGRLLKTDYDMLSQGGVFVLLGPAGVGKTTTLAKLAATYAIAHGTESILFVNTDDYRIGAQDQLSTYANILNIKQETYGRKQEIRPILQKIKEHRLVLIDTAGQNEPDDFLQEFIKTLSRNRLQPRKLLLMSASTQLDCLRQTVDHYRDCNVDGYVITKTDETLQLGNVLTLAIEDRMPLWYETNGQRVPEDFLRIDATNLIQRALQNATVEYKSSSMLERELLLSYQQS